MAGPISVAAAMMVLGAAFAAESSDGSSATSAGRRGVPKNLSR
jgi:hypothetical protein